MIARLVGDESQVGGHCYLKTLARYRNHSTRFVERAQSVACLLVLIAPCGKHFQPKEQTTQHGVKALDSGDADAADSVELRGLQVLDVVKLGELAAVVGRDELLEFFQGLVAEVAAVDEEEDAARAGELDEAVNEVDGGVGLAAAGGHLDEG